jgi:hypothetical protein
VSDGAERKHLPEPLMGLGESIDEPVSRRAQVANAEGARQGGDVKEDTANASRVHGEGRLRARTEGPDGCRPVSGHERRGGAGVSHKGGRSTVSAVGPLTSRSLRELGTLVG